MNESGLETQEYKERLYFEMYSAAQELYGLRAGTYEYKERLYFEMYSAAQELYGLRAGTYYAFSQKMDKIFGAKDGEQ